MKRIILFILILCCVTGLVAAQDESEQPEHRVYVSDDGTITFEYPPSWWMVRDEYDGFTLTTDPFILDRRAEGYHKLYFDEATVSIMLFPTDYAERDFGVVGETAAERLASISSNFGESLEIGEIETLDNGISRVYIRQGDDYEGWVVIWDISDDLFGFAVMATGVDYLEEIEPIIEEILLSFEFSSTVEEILSIRQGGQDS